jgi:hypothetical protein
MISAFELFCWFLPCLLYGLKAGNAERGLKRAREGSKRAREGSKKSERGVYRSEKNSSIILAAIMHQESNLFDIELE